MNTQVTLANNSQIIVALDYSNAIDALKMADQLDPNLCRLKVGKELFTGEGPSIVKQLIEKNFDVFLDLKFHDIPTTVARACKAAADLGVWMLNVHAMGGRKMMDSAAESLKNYGSNKPLLIAVTVLTSMGKQDLTEISIDLSAHDQVLRLAELADQSGMDGLVCSAREANELRKNFPDFTLVTPGIRPGGSDANDQQRVMTPEKAISSGSNYLVIGRPITTAKDPMQVVSSIQNEIQNL